MNPRSSVSSLPQDPDKLYAAVILMEAITRWQLDTLVHPLTCAVESDHRPLLLPCWDEERQCVYLWCPECDYRQDSIPECVLVHERRHVTPKSGQHVFRRPL